MPLTRDFRTVVAERAQSDPGFRVGLLEEAVNAMLDGDLDVSKSLLRDYVNATIGFDGLADAMGKDKTSLMRMLSTKGNPRADNLLALIAQLQAYEGVEIKAHAQAAG